MNRDRHVAAASAALVELDRLAAAAGRPASFTAFDAILIRDGAAGSLSGPRELLSGSSIRELDAALDALLLALRPYLLYRAGLKLLDVLIQLHQLHRCAASSSRPLPGSNTPLPSCRHRPQLLLLTALPFQAVPALARLPALLRPHLRIKSLLRNLTTWPAPRSTFASVAAASSKPCGEQHALIPPSRPGCEAHADHGEPPLLPHFRR